MTRTILRCPCDHPACRDWHVSDEAAIRGVKFTEEQAHAVAAVLDALDGDLGRVRLLDVSGEHLDEGPKLLQVRVAKVSVDADGNLSIWIK